MGLARLDGLTVDALTDFLPFEVTLDIKTVRHDTLKIAERCEAELVRTREFHRRLPTGLGQLTYPGWAHHRGHRRGLCARLGGEEA